MQLYGFLLFLNTLENVFNGSFRPKYFIWVRASICSKHKQFTVCGCGLDTMLCMEVKKRNETQSLLSRSS